MHTDSLHPDSRVTDSLHTGSPHSDSPLRDARYTDSLQTNSLHTELVHTHSAALLLAVRKPWLLSTQYLAEEVDFNSTRVDQFQVDYFPYPIWRDESMHRLVVGVALGAAEAIAQSGRYMRMGRHVMLRVDIALTRQGNLVSACGLFNL